MGLFDGLLKAVETGGLEQTVGKALDGLEHKLDGAISSAEKLVDKSDQFGQKVDGVARRAERTIGAIDKKIQG